MRIFLSGPMTGVQCAGETLRNVGHIAARLVRVGHAVYVPHLSWFVEAVSHVGREDWLTQDLEWIRVCDAVLRLPGESKGADSECEFAREVGVPVYHSVNEVLDPACRLNLQMERLNLLMSTESTPGTNEEKPES